MTETSEIHPEATSRQRPVGSRVLPAILALRVHQWVKNLLLFVPLALAHQLSVPRKDLLGIIGFFAFSFAASAVYLLNDLIDREADRRHPIKQHRPLAAGTLSVRAGIGLAGGLLVLALLTSTTLLPRAFGFWLFVYLVATSLYSFWLKQKLLVDVIVLALLYTLRIRAGAAAVDVPLTMWLQAFSLFLFLSLAFVKRYAELVEVQGQGGRDVHGRGYVVDDLRIIESVGPASGYMAVVVFYIYLDQSNVVRELYPHAQVLWLIGPVLLYWITRLWFLARRRALHEDPILFALRDTVSLLCGAACVAIVAAAGWKGRWPL